MDPYQSCPCGSGKSFKWCCQAYYHIVEKARTQHQQGQHDTALRTMQQLVEQHPGAAPPLGFQAEMLYMNGKVEEADEALQKAFAFHADFPFGHWLRGVIRKDEGEIKGALLQFRKAAELYDPKANDALAEINAAIFDIELRMNRPVAARAVLERAIRADPTAEQLRKAFDQLYGGVSRLPASATKAYAFRPAAARYAEAWKIVIPAREHGRFSDAQTAFEKLTKQDGADAAAWFNLGLALAWLGKNAEAIEALQQAIDHEDNEGRNTEAAALIEVLRCGDGMEDLADHVEHRAFFRMQDVKPMVDLLSEWDRAARLTGTESNEENGTFSTLVLETTPQFGIGLGSPLAKLAGYLFIIQNIVRLWHPNKQSLEKLVHEMAGRLGASVSPPTFEHGRANFSDVTLEAMVFPTRDAPIEDLRTRMEEHARNWFEETWLQKPLKSLSGVSPLDAAGHATIRKRLSGVIQFIEECFIRTIPRHVVDEEAVPIFHYDFDRLRRKLGLTSAEAPALVNGPSIDAMSTAELAALDPILLSDADLETAFRTAIQTDAREVAGTFAKLVVDRPATPASGDRYPYFNHLMQQAQTENDTTAILSLLERAEKADADSNNGLRQNDYAMRRGQVLSQHGDIDRSHEVFEGLLASAPNELKYYGPAIEAMLGQKKGQWALQFAEQGLAKARALNNRDSERYFMELADAARKLIG